MKLLEWTIKEALRLYPPIILVMRRVLKAFEFGGYNVPEGAMLFASPAVSGRIPDIFAEPQRCDPDRYGPAARRTRSRPTATSPSAPAATAAWASCSPSCSSAPCGATSSATSNFAARRQLPRRLHQPDRRAHPALSRAIADPLLARPWVAVDMTRPTHALNVTVDRMPRAPRHSINASASATVDEQE
jgi:hypothetical protein